MHIKYDRDDLLKILAYFYMLMVMALTKIGLEFDFMLFLIYLLLAIPFYKKTEYYISICILLSTISYYFVGAYEHVLSIYTILAIIQTLAIITSGKKVNLNFQSLIYTFLLCINICISYNNSVHSYLLGFLRLSYIVSVFYYIFAIKRVELQTIADFLPKLGSLMIFCEVLMVLSNFILTSDTRLRIAQEVNSNTFAMSCAINTCILGLAINNDSITKTKAFVFKFSMAISFILLILTGSRTALMAFILAYSVTLFIKARRAHKIKGYLGKIMIVSIILMMFMYVIASIFGLDISRYDYISAVANGGTNRAAIYEMLIPYIMKNDYYIWGYGPGHDTTRGLLQVLVYEDYAHSHNTFLEAFGELGFIGLVLTVLYTATAMKKINQYCLVNTSGYTLFAIIISILVNSMGESYFCYAVFWLMLNLIIHNIKSQTKLS